jgi:hypothetical protein
MDLIEKTRARDIKPKANQMQCEDVSIFAWGMSKKLRYDEGLDSDKEEYDYSLALGLCFGTLFNGVPQRHYQLMAYCEEGLLLIEPQKNIYWGPQRTDKVLWWAI